MEFKIGDIVYDEKYNEVFEVSKGDMFVLENRAEDFRLATEEEIEENKKH